jgi:apolipoprotein N-acyltransferase
MCRLRISRVLGWPGLRVLAAGFGLGLLAAAGQAPLGAWWLAVPALAGVVHLVARAEPGGAAVWIALCAGLGYFGAVLNWIVEPFMVDAAKDGWMAPFAVVFLAFGMALFWAGAAVLARAVPQRTWGFAVALTAMELMRGYMLTGFPWALIGHVWIDTPVAQAAAIVGPAGLTLMTLLMAALLASRRWLGIAGAMTILVAGWGYGLWALGQPSPAAPGIMLRLVQPNAAQAAKWDPAEARKFFDRLLAYTAVKPAPDMVIWPETALPYLLERHPELQGMIATAGGGAPVVVGRQRTDGALGWNSLTVIAPDGTIAANYDKHHLVPFGEYMPLGDLVYDWFGISALAAQMGNGYSAGPGPQVLDLGPLGRVLPLICYEAVFPQDLRGTTRADWILQITNDAWFGTLSGPFQHLAQARLRAIEQGLPLVRVANTGVTGVYDARGRQVAVLPFGVAAYLDAALPGPLPMTPYARWGEWPVLVLLAGLAVVLFLRRKQSVA